MRVVVIGAGKMGLPLACQFASRGALVTACDVREDVVAAINQGQCPIDEPGVAEMLAVCVKSGTLTASTNTARAAADADVLVIIVPALLTPDNNADLSILSNVARTIAPVIKNGALVSFETTLPVGTTRQKLRLDLESAGRTAGVDFYLAFSPERVKSQSVLKHLTHNPKVVGGFTRACAAKAAGFYGEYLGAPVNNVETLEAAEFVKVAGMVYRDVTIGLANELGRYAQAVGVDLPSLLSAINSDGEAALLSPGIGVGGHCTPVYPYFMIRDAERRGTPLVMAHLARSVNDGQALHALTTLERSGHSLKGKRVLILGLAFRPQVKEHICSTAFLLRDELERKGAYVALHDPLYSAEEIAAHGFVPGALYDPIDVVILQTAHDAYAALDFTRWQTHGLAAVVDGRNFWPQLAIAGLTVVGIGKPVIATNPPPAVLPIAKPLLGSEEAVGAVRAIQSGWIMQGPEVAALEDEFTAYTGARHACAVSSGTAALHLALLALGIKPGDEVVTASHSYIATGNSIRYCGATPVFADIDPVTFNLSPASVAEKIGPRTRAIMVVHQIGMPCDLRALLSLAESHGLPVIEDAACAAGSEIEWHGRWERIGKPHGRIACFSFHPRKILTTGDGGMIVTDDSALDEKMRILRQHGMRSPELPFEFVGYNYRLSDIQAAVGRAQLARLPQLVQERRTQAAFYHRALADIVGVTRPVEPSWARTNWQSYCIRLASLQRPVQIMSALAAKGIQTRAGIMNAHLEPCYEQLYGRQSLPASEAAQAECMCLPLFPGMTQSDIGRVADALKQVLV